MQVVTYKLSEAFVHYASKLRLNQAQVNDPRYCFNYPTWQYKQLHELPSSGTKPIKGNV